MRRNMCWNEKQRIERERLDGPLAGNQVRKVRGVEGAAKNAQSHGLFLYDEFRG
jgi:hypothetical protein